MSELRIALVTPAYAEEQMLPRLAASIAAQTVAPVAWAIVDDGSPDATGESQPPSPRPTSTCSR